MRNVLPTHPFESCYSTIDDLFTNIENAIEIEKDALDHAVIPTPCAGDRHVGLRPPRDDKSALT
jgi:hypothetical protein